MTDADPPCIVCGDAVTVDQSATKYPDGRWVHYCCKPYLALRETAKKGSNHE